MSSQKTQERIRSRRAVLLGATIVAAVVLLWFALRRETVPQVSAESIVPATEDLVARVSAPEGTVPATDAMAPPSPAPAGSFTVQLRPLQYDAADALVLARVNEYYAAFAYGLRAVPGLHLVDDEASADFRVTLSNLDPADAQHMLLSSEWAAKASVEVLNGSIGTAGPAGTVYVLGMVGDAWRGRAPDTVATHAPLSGDCETPTVMPCSPAGIAERQVMALRKKVFPRDGSLERELEARFLDAALPMREHDRVMSDVLSMKMALSDEMVRNVLARIARSPDRNLLALLAGQRRPEIVQPLIDMARYDSDSSLRIEAVKLLAADFPKDSSARAALEQIAADPSNPTLQTTAKGVLGGLPGN
ncbi:MAG: hypothetical protein ABI645_04330 [Pseudomonadota bacterium]